MEAGEAIEEMKFPLRWAMVHGCSVTLCSLLWCSVSFSKIKYVFKSLLWIHVMELFCLDWEHRMAVAMWIHALDTFAKNGFYTHMRECV